MCKRVGTEELVEKRLDKEHFVTLGVCRRSTLGIKLLHWSSSQIEAVLLMDERMPRAVLKNLCWLLFVHPKTLRHTKAKKDLCCFYCGKLRNSVWMLRFALIVTEVY